MVVMARGSVCRVRRSYLPPLLLLSAIWGSSYMFIKVGARDFSPAALASGLVVWGRRPAAAVPKP